MAILGPPLNRWKLFDFRRRRCQPLSAIGIACPDVLTSRVKRRDRMERVPPSGEIAHSLTPQCDHRVHAQCPPQWQPARRERRASDDHRNRREHPWVARPCGSRSSTITSSFAREHVNGCSSVGRIRLKIAVDAPIPSAIVTTAAKPRIIYPRQSLLSIAKMFRSRYRPQHSSPSRSVPSSVNPRRRGIEEALRIAGRAMDFDAVVQIQLS